MCQRKLSRKHFIKNKTDYYDRQERRRLKHAEIVSKIKEDSRCCMCGEDRPVCLDFHHQDESEKDFTIASSLSFSLERILNEIDKCIIVCANCHRVIHAEQNGELL